MRQEIWTEFRRLEASAASLGRFLFGDRLGLAVFLGAVLWCGALWRVGIFIQDTVTVANALANVGDGHLALVESPYALTLGTQPGLVEVGGQAFGRNYGQVFLALPLLWLFEGLSTLVSPRFLLAGGWSLGLVAFSTQLGRVTGRRRVVTVGSALALVVFFGNLLTATALPDGVLALVALQLSTILAAGGIAVVLYRLLSRFHGRRVGVAAGAAVVLATPVGFWASIPKRHIVTAGAAVLSLYLFAVSRDRTDRRGALARAGSYAVLGLLTTVHPFEAFFLFAVLVPVDLLTAPSNSLRTLGLVGLVFACSLLPFFAVNTLISGNPLKSPRLISGYGSRYGETIDLGGGSGGSTGGGGGASGGSGSAGSGGAGGGSGAGGSTTGTGAGTAGGAGGGSGGGGIGGFVAGFVAMANVLVGFAGSVVGFAAEWTNRSLAVVSQPDRLYHTFVRSGEIPSISTRLNDYEAIELTLLESFPLAAGLAYLPVAAGHRLRERVGTTGLRKTERQTDVLAAGFALVFALVYLPRLPLYSQITVRYILPVMPLLLYGLARSGQVHRALRTRARWLVGSYLAVVGVGGVALAGALTTLDPAIGEAMQLHALLGLAAGLVAVAAVLSWPVHEDVRVVAVGLAVAAGVTTLFLVFAKVEYFSYRLPSSDSPHVYALDVVRVLADLLPVFP